MSKDSFVKALPSSFPALPIQARDERLQCAICTYLLNGPLQFPCGHRICTPCARKLKQDNAVTFHCMKCNEMIIFSDYFHDKAVAKEVDSTVVTCPYCTSWNGEYRNLQNHIKDECQMVKVSCPNEGCSKVVIKSQYDDHVQNCQFSRNTNGYWDRYNNDSFVAKGKSTQKCQFNVFGCQFVGNDLELTKHIEKDINNHLRYVCKVLLSINLQSSHISHSLSSHNSNDDYVPTTECSMERLLFADYEEVEARVEKLSNEGSKTKSQATEIQEKQKEITFRLTGVEDLLAILQANITEINRTYEEVSLTLQTLQATSYDGKYIWKIPDITRRRRDALMGKTVSLYSAPFYTDRFGYRMCLRVYLDGDGSGKGRYISYFLTIMKGEYDALLEWSFQLTVTLTMINQKGNGNIVQSFKPNPNSASFHQPKADMNVASGCPKFAPLSLLDNQEFVVDDVAFFQCVVNNNRH